MSTADENNQLEIQDSIEKADKVEDEAETNRQNTDSLPITYLYLDFDTDLPQPDVVLGQNEARALDLLCPDLKPFTSPLQWPLSRKYLLLALSCIATFLTAYTAGSYSPSSQIMAEDIAASQLAVIVGITTFCLGFAMAPMILAPLSELWGRYPIFVVAGLCYVAFQAVCSVVTNLAGMLIARLFVGIGGSVFSSVVGGVIADLWTKDGRNAPMALFSGSVLVGTGAGPLVSAVMVGKLGEQNSTLAWKWVFWHQVIMGSVLMVFLIFLFHESRGSVLLARKAKALNSWYERLEKAGTYGVKWPEGCIPVAAEVALYDSDTQNGTLFDEEKTMVTTTPIRGPSSSSSTIVRVRWVAKGSDERKTILGMVAMSVYRPFYMLITEPVVFFFSVWCAFAWAVLYLTFGSIPLVFARVYKMDIEQAGYVFIAMIVGSVIATIVGIFQEKLLKHPRWTAEDDGGNDSQTRFWRFMRRHFPADAPEARLYFTCITSIFLPAGLFLFGFSARSDCHWIVPAFGVGLATWGIYSIYLAVFNYLADSYHVYASSALAAQSCCRNVLGGSFPLVTRLIFERLGEAGAGGLLGGIALGLTVIPWVLAFYGDRIRARSRFATELQGVRNR